MCEEYRKANSISKILTWENVGKYMNGQSLSSLGIRISALFAPHISILRRRVAGGVVSVCQSSFGGRAKPARRKRASSRIALTISNESQKGDDRHGHCTTQRPGSEEARAARGARGVHRPAGFRREVPEDPPELARFGEGRRGVRVDGRGAGAERGVRARGEASRRQDTLGGVRVKFYGKSRPEALSRRWSSWRIRRCG